MNAGEQESSDFLDVKAAAELAGLSSSSMYEAIKNRLVAHYRMSGTGRRGAILIRRADLEKFIESRRVEVEAKAAAYELKHISAR